VTVKGPLVPVACWPPRAGSLASVAVTVYPVTGLLPLLAGASKLTVADAMPAVADTAAAMPGP
jgi:hypothetical protein